MDCVFKLVDFCKNRMIVFFPDYVLFTVLKSKYAFFPFIENFSFLNSIDTLCQWRRQNL